MLSRHSRWFCLLEREREREEKRAFVAFKLVCIYTSRIWWYVSEEEKRKKNEEVYPSIDVHIVNQDERTKDRSYSRWRTTERERERAKEPRLLLVDLISQLTIRSWRETNDEQLGWLSSHSIFLPFDDQTKTNPWTDLGMNPSFSLVQLSNWMRALVIRSSSFSSSAQWFREFVSFFFFFFLPSYAWKVCLEQG